MSGVHVSANADARARGAANLTPADRTLLKAGMAIRNARGKFRANYTPDEVNVVARARRLLHVIGEGALARRLVLRSGIMRPYVPIVGSRSTNHSCPLCGRVHPEPGKKQKKRR